MRLKSQNFNSPADLPKVKIMLYVLKSVHSELPLKGNEEHWDPLDCKMEKQHQIKFDEGNNKFLEPSPRSGKAEGRSRIAGLF